MPTNLEIDEVLPRPLWSTSFTFTPRINIVLVQCIIKNWKSETEIKEILFKFYGPGHNVLVYLD